MNKRSKLFVSVTAIVTATLCFGSAMALDKEGRLDVVDCYSGEIDLIQHADNNFWLSWKQTGTRRSVKKGGPFDGMTAHCAGFLWNSLGEMNGHSACEYVDHAGNKLFVKAARVGDDAEWRFVGGTGIYKGITGSGEFTGFSYFPQLTPTTYQFCPTSNGTYRLGDH